MTAVATPSSVERELDQSLPALLLQRSSEIGGRVALRHNELSRWREYTWEEYAARTARIGMALLELGVQPGDRVAIHSENRPEWVMTDLAIQGIGCASVGVYPTSPSAEVEYLLAHSRAVVLVAEDEEQLDKVLEVRKNLPHLRKIVVIETLGVRRQLDDPMIMTFGELEALGAERPVAEWAEHVARLQPADVAMIVYTSGTTGPPKGAMLSHANLIAATTPSTRSSRPRRTTRSSPTCPCATSPSG